MTTLFLSLLQTLDLVLQNLALVIQKEKAQDQAIRQLSQKIN